jgi:hypothetical protein
MQVAGKCPPSKKKDKKIFKRDLERKSMGSTDKTCYTL